ncbi:MAG: ribosomal RNA small subunit methyltransferase A [Erysipelotrichaceae bacterium]|nr:ribosomal RNA small subunit methyltransferase A [Erysipelotrichaceae bacterium]
MEHVAKLKNTLNVLERFDLKPSKKFGQNFLVDENVIRKIIELAAITQDTTVIEVGPGIGALSEAAAHQAKRVLCFEIDERLKDVLDYTIGEYDNVEVHFEDFLKVDLKEILSHLSGDICLLSNLPYYITTDLIEKILLEGEDISRIVVMVQKEVAQKLTSDDKSPLKYLIDYSGDIKYGFTVSKNVFVPAPHIDSAVLLIQKEHNVPKEYYDVVQAAFKAKRKTIANNMKVLFKKETSNVLERCGIAANQRAEQLSVEEFKLLTKEWLTYED